MLRRNSNFDYEACIKEFHKLVFKINSYHNFCSDEEVKILTLVKNLLDNPTEESFEIFVECCRDNRNGTVFGTGVLSDKLEGSERRDLGKIKNIKI